MMCSCNVFSDKIWDAPVVGLLVKSCAMAARRRGVGRKVEEQRMKSGLHLRMIIAATNCLCMTVSLTSH